jgi:hypothetical protein
MVDDVPLRTAVHTVWSLYLAKHRDVDASRRRMLRLVEVLVRRAAVGSARPDWTLLAVSELASAAIVLFFRSMFLV